MFDDFDDSDSCDCTMARACAYHEEQQRRQRLEAEIGHQRKAAFAKAHRAETAQALKLLEQARDLVRGAREAELAISSAISTLGFLRMAADRNIDDNVAPGEIIRVIDGWK